MSQRRPRVRIQSRGDTSAHSIRCSDSAWEAAKARAESEGWKINGVLAELIEGYAEGKINPPEVVRVYDLKNK